MNIRHHSGRSTGRTAGRPDPRWPTVGLPAPQSCEETARGVRLPGGWARTLAVTGYPRQVGPGWLDPLLRLPEQLEISVHASPLPAGLAADRLRRAQARLESARRIDAAKDRLPDPAVHLAAQDAADLAGALAAGEGRLFTVGVYLTVWAPDPAGLDVACGRITATCRSMLLDTVVTVFRQHTALASTRPHSADRLGITRVMDTAALAAAYPFTTPVLTAPAGPGALLYGRAADSLVFYDRFAADNHNMVILAASGAGKSYLAKLEALRALCAGTQVLIIDPEGEYGPLATAVGGTQLTLGAAGVHLNPLDLPPTTLPRASPPGAGPAEVAPGEVGPAGGGGEVLGERALLVHTLADLLLRRQLTAAERAGLDSAISVAYQQAGISADRRTHTRPAPLLAAVTAALTGQDPAGPGPRLGAELAPFTTGSFARLFSGATGTPPAGHLVVFSLRELPAELRPAGLLLALDAIWAQVTGPVRRRRMVLVDEAWLLAGEPAGARFLLRMAKSARKYLCGLTCVTQDAADLLDTATGQAVIANSATQILLRQAPQALPRLSEMFALSAGERQLLAAAPRGSAILAAGTDRVALQVIASPAEHALAAGPGAGPA